MKTKAKINDLPGYRINLNKTAIENLEIERQNRRFWIGLFFYLILIGGFVYFGYVFNERIDGKIRDREIRLEQINTELAQLQKNPRFVSEEDVRMLAEFERERLLWTPKIAALADVIPQKAVYTDLLLAENQFVVEGISEVREDQKELDFVLSLIDSVKANKTLEKDFGKVDFKFSRRIRIADQPVLEFGIVAGVRSPNFSKNGNQE